MLVLSFKCEPGFKNAVIGLVHKVKTLQARIVSGSVILLSGSGLTTAVNLAYNIAIARFLGPRDLDTLRLFTRFSPCYRQ
jgi:hypothetical protein